MKQVLVTGGAGFIGSNFVPALLEHEKFVRIRTLDALTYAGDGENLSDLPDPARHTLIEGDICDEQLVEQLLRDHQIDTIVHFAAETHVDRSIARPETFVRTNVQGTLSLLEAARTVWLGERGWGDNDCRFHHISTDEVYGSLNPEDPPFTEQTPYAPNSPYAASKAAADHLVRSYVNTYGLPATLSNCSNNYGPHQYPEKLIPVVLLNALNGIPLPIYGDGQQIRDWLYVEDHAGALLQVLERGKVGETYNVSAGVQITNLELVETICGLLDEMVPGSQWAPHRNLIEFVEDRPGHDRRYAMDSQKIRTELGWEIRVDLKEGLRRTIQWYMDHPAWIDRIRAKPDYQEWIQQHYSLRGEAA
jgi:dTDP-glucose 4,6-dehydratase